MSIETFTRATSPDAYANQIAHLYAAGYRLYDPSIAAERDPDHEAKMMRWPPFATAFQIRHTSIAGRRWTVVKADDGGEDEKRLAKIVSRLLGHIDGFTQARINLARADVTGARYAEVVKRVIVAKYGDGKAREWVVPVALRDMPKENFRWDAASDEAQSKSVLKFARKRNGVLSWVPVPGYAPLIRHVIGDSEETLGYGRGLRDALWFLFGAATRVHQADVQAAERFGHGWLVLKLRSDAKGSPTVTNAQLVSTSSTALDKMRAKHNFVIGSEDTLEMLAPPAQAAQFMAALADRLERMGDRLIMGGTLFSGGQANSKGGYAQADSEAETATGIFDVCADMLEETFTRDLVAPCVRDNWANLVELGFADTDHPRFSVVRGRKQDPESGLRRVAAARGAGMAVKKSQAYELGDLEEPSEEDIETGNVLDPIVPVDPLTGEPRDMGGDGLDGKKPRKPVGVEDDDAGE